MEWGLDQIVTQGQESFMILHIGTLCLAEQSTYITGAMIVSPSSKGILKDQRVRASHRHLVDQSENIGASAGTRKMATKLSTKRRSPAQSIYCISPPTRRCPSMQNDNANQFQGQLQRRTPQSNPCMRFYTRT